MHGGFPKVRCAVVLASRYSASSHYYTLCIIKFDTETRFTYMPLGCDLGSAILHLWKSTEMWSL